MEFVSYLSYFSYIRKLFVISRQLYSSTQVTGQLFRRPLRAF